MWLEDFKIHALEKFKLSSVKKKMMHKYILFISFIIISLVGKAQKSITLEDIWNKGTFRTNSVPGFNFQKDGQHYTRKEDNKIVQYNILTGEQSEILLDPSNLQGKEGFSGNMNAYTFSEDESNILIKSESESIYRRSSKAEYFVYDVEDQGFTSVHREGKIMYAYFSPDASKVAYVFRNNLYYKDLNTGSTIQITNDGKNNVIINGAGDWVYEEEFSLSRAFEWSPDSKKLAFIRFDESKVPEFTFQKYNDGLYPINETFKYPKVGEKNAEVSVHIFHCESGKLVDAKVKTEQEFYIPRIKWTPYEDQLIVFRMNRHQNQLELLNVNANDGLANMLLEELNQYYIDIHDNLRFQKDKKQFIWTSEKDGYNHIYLYGLNGKQIRDLTPGSFDVTQFYGIDEKTGLVYYQAATKNPMEREIFSVSINSGIITEMSTISGTNNAQFSSNFSYYVLNHSTANKAPEYIVYGINGRKIRTIENNAEIGDLQKSFGVTAVEFFQFNTSEKVLLNAYMIKPNDFNPKKKYPVFMYLYGGPGSQTVTDSWNGTQYWWFQMLAQQGYIVVSVDNRGTGARGEKFRKMTYMQLGKYETIDQIEAAKYLSKQSYIDGNRIGIFGWSYGGYMSSLCILKGNDTFKAAIAVAPVTSWKWYDSIYTERYMRTLEENQAGYLENSPVYFADRLKGAYLLVHGMADDNVHFQNSVEMMDALIRSNKQFDSYIYPNRNHGIYGNNARLHLYTKMTDFIKTNI